MSQTTKPDSTTEPESPVKKDPDELTDEDLDKVSGGLASFNQGMKIQQQTVARVAPGDIPGGIDPLL